ncbi:MAG: PIN domain-containing protein [Thaumarchaeota archaeon]|nr:PIN domain-containing protein [Nitrososphaerota archaeon]
MDSSLIIALADTDDQFHKTAVQVAPELHSEKVISDLVVSESVTGVGARLGERAGREVFENLVHDPTVKTIHLNKRLMERSLQTYVKHGARLSFADSVSVRIMYDMRIKEIASFDSDFDGIEGITRIH